MHSPMFLRRILCLLAACMLLAPCACAADNTEALFDAALASLMTPAQLGDATGCYTLRTGDTAYVPCLSPGVIPYDQQDGMTPPVVTDMPTSSNEGVVSVAADGTMTGVAPGVATVVCGEHSYEVTVADDAMPETIKNYIYVLNREFYSVKRDRLPKYNQYAKWYYGKKKEVGWCAVFTAFCANASGNRPITLDELKDIGYENAGDVQFLRQGQVGHQYDGFWDMERFVGVPKPGYLVIYADMSNAYRTVHVGSVSAVEDMGGGVYAVTTVEGNMSNSVKSYCYLYDSNKANHLVGQVKGEKLKNNMAVVPESMQTDPLVQYELHTDHWSVFGFCQTWK